MSHSPSRTISSAVAAAPLVLLAALPAIAEPCTGPSIWHLFPPGAEGSQAIYDLPLAVAGLWRPGTGALPVPDLEVEALDLAGKVNQPGDNRRIADFEMYRMDGEQRYALAYSPEEAVEQLDLDLPAAAFATAFGAGQNAATDLRKYLVDFETYLDGGQRRYAALFAKGARGQDLELQIGGDAIKTRVEGSLLRRRQLVEFEMLTPGSSVSPPTFAAVFEETQGTPQRFFPRLDPGEFHGKVHQQNGQSYRLEGFETWREEDGDTLFAALFVQSNAADHLFVQNCTGGICQEAAGQATSHLKAVLDTLSVAKPALRLADFELPLGRKEGFGVIHLGDGGAPDKLSTRKTAPAKADLKLGGITTPVPPTCQHGGVLHDGGTNGPPDP